MKKIASFIVVLVMAACFIFSGNAMANVDYIDLNAVLENLKNVPVGPVKKQEIDTMYLITWAGDEATLKANGDSLVTTQDSIFGNMGLKFKLVLQNNLVAQTQSLLRGDTWSIRGTAGMLNSVVEICAKDPRTQLVPVYKISWSYGEDCLVVKSHIKSLKDLKGKTIVLQAPGPHLDLLFVVLKIAGLKFSDVNVRWVADLTNAKNTPPNALYADDIDAAFMLNIDGEKNTGGGDDAINGARTIFSTREMDKAISDEIWVRKDYLDANREKVEKMVHGLLLGEQKLAEFFKAKPAGYEKTLRFYAGTILGDPEAWGDAEGMYYGCNFVGLAGNVEFFDNEKSLVGFSAMTKKLQDYYIQMGILSKPIPIAHAGWDYNAMKAGLTGADQVKVKTFNRGVLKQVIAQKVLDGTLKTDSIIQFPILFGKDQATFDSAQYGKDFDNVIEAMAHSGGAPMVIVCHADPLGWLKAKYKDKLSELELRKIRQAAMDLSANRGLAVKMTVIKYANGKGTPINESQFEVLARGIEDPFTGINAVTNEPNPPKNKDEWRNCRRVVFRMITVKAEADEFELIDTGN